ncbi:DUF732 domain-containing protein [Rhodococcus sp. BP-241]|nr:DUF732 domain-containing protein [Rhodococcus sp. BP-241]
MMHKRSSTLLFFVLAAATASSLVTGCSTAESAPCAEPMSATDDAAFDYVNKTPSAAQNCSDAARENVVADYRYLRAVDDEAVPFTDADVAIKVGKGMCTLIGRAVSNGYSVSQARELLLDQSNAANVYTSSDNVTIQTAALASYCPNYNR